MCRDAQMEPAGVFDIFLHDFMNFLTDEGSVVVQGKPDRQGGEKHNGQGDVFLPIACRAARERFRRRDVSLRSKRREFSEILVFLEALTTGARSMGRYLLRFARLVS